jgi:hypothetical protein
MQYTRFLALAAAAFATCCFAQKNAADAVKSIDSITQTIADVETLVNGAPADDLTETELVSWISEPFQLLPRLLADTGMNKAVLKQYRDLVVVEGDFNNNVSPEIESTAAEKEKEQICASQNRVRSISLTSSTFSFSARGQELTSVFTVVVY